MFMYMYQSDSILHILARCDSDIPVIVVDSHCERLSVRVEEVAVLIIAQRHVMNGSSGGGEEQTTSSRVDQDALRIQSCNKRDTITSAFRSL